jgi:hypothetical protein
MSSARGTEWLISRNGKALQKALGEYNGRNKNTLCRTAVKISPTPNALTAIRSAKVRRTFWIIEKYFPFYRFAGTFIGLESGNGVGLARCVAVAVIGADDKIFFVGVRDDALEVVVLGEL